MVLRSAKGLKSGEFQVGYAPPLSGNVRLGVLENIEARYLYLPETQAWDILYHFTKNDNSFGITAGALHKYSKKPIFHSSVIISRQWNKFFYPYVGYTYGEGMFINNNGFISVGIETYIVYKNFPISVVITPEVNMFYPKISIPLSRGKSHFTGTINIGLNFNFTK
jgi:hypothetical protein